MAKFGTGIVIRIGATQDSVSWPGGQVDDRSTMKGMEKKDIVNDINRLHFGAKQRHADRRARKGFANA